MSITMAVADHRQRQPRRRAGGPQKERPTDTATPRFYAFLPDDTMHLRVKTIRGRFKVQLGTEVVVGNDGLERSGEVRWTDWVPFDVPEGTGREGVEDLLRQGFPGAIVTWSGRPPQQKAARRRYQPVLPVDSGDGHAGDGHAGDGYAGDGHGGDGRSGDGIPTAAPAKEWLPVVVVPGRKD